MHVSITYHPFAADRSPHPQLPYSTGVPAMAVRGTSGKLAVAFRRGMVLLPMFFNCCIEAS